VNPDLIQAVRNWLRKAENDLKIGIDQMETVDPVTDMICYHMQQCTEKCLKAFLTAHGRSFRRTHDIAELIELCKDIDETFGDLYSENVDRLTVYAVEIRYPDFFYMPTQEETAKAIGMAQLVNDFVRRRILSEDQAVEGSEDIDNTSEVQE
jgi:HEPN domain-containing protein